MTLKNKTLLTIVVIWAAWAAIIVGYQTLVSERVAPQRPDYSREWTPPNTLKNSNLGHIYLTEPFMNRQVAWDLEYYLSIAVTGYADPAVPFVTLRGGEHLSLNYAFFPLFPLAAGALALPLRALDLTPIAAATLAGVILSLLGALVGAISLYDLARDHLDEAGGVRATFYLLVFPTGFFLAQMYTEGLFVGLAFGSLALIKHKRLFLAGVCAALAVWTRAVGLALIIPLALAWLSSIHWRGLRQDWQAALRPYLRLILGLIGVLLPIGAYLIWQHFLGKNFNTVELNWFGRKLFDFKGTQAGWTNALDAIAHGNLQMRIYYSDRSGGGRAGADRLSVHAATLSGDRAVRADGAGGQLLPRRAAELDPLRAGYPVDLSVLGAIGQKRLLRPGMDADQRAAARSAAFPVHLRHVGGVKRSD